MTTHSLFALIYTMLLVPDRKYGSELLDLPPGAHAEGELAESLADIRQVNRYLGGISSVLGHFTNRAGALTEEKGVRELSVLDIGTGSADIPVALVDWARGRGIALSVTAVDVNPGVLDVAREYVKEYPEITLAVADGLTLPFPDASFDFVVCSLTLHHLSEHDARRLLKRIAGLARSGYIVGDLRRSWVAFGLIYVISRILTKNRLTRFDGPLSVLRSYTDRELSEMALSAGLDGFSVVRHPFWRMALVGGRG